MTAEARLTTSRSTTHRGLDRSSATVLKAAAGVTCYALAVEFYARVEAVASSSRKRSSQPTLPAEHTNDGAGQPAAAQHRSPWFRKLAANVIFAAMALSWFFMLRPAALGGPATVIRVTGVSMEPGMHTGDLAIVHTDESYEVGEVVAFRVPNDDGSAGPYVIHRIVAEADGVFTLRGDNNDHDDPWDVRRTDIAGQLWWHSPAAGTVVNYLSDPIIAAAVLASLTAFLIIAGPEPKRDDSAEPTTQAGNDVEVQA